MMHAWTCRVDRLRNRVLRLLLAGVAAAAAAPTLAHKSSDAYVFLQATTLRADIALRDLDEVLSLDTSGDGQLSWGEVRSARATIEAFVQAGMVLDGCHITPREFGLETRPDGTYAALHFDARCAPGVSATTTGLRYTLFAGVDPTHRAITRVQGIDGGIELRLLDPQRPVSASAAPPHIDAPARTAMAVGLTVGEPPSGPEESFVMEGLHHILGGYDHVLFLLCLLLPAVMQRTPRTGKVAWTPLASLQQALRPVIVMVTMFTLAHSVTLALAAFRIATLPSWVIEPAIALTIIATAVDNIRPVFRWPRSTMAFVFGLVHGFGFAEVLAQLNLPPLQFAWALLQFNVGLELGQLGIVVCAVSLLYLLRERPGYPRWVIHGGSAAALTMGVWWLAQRVGMLDALQV